MLKEIFDFYVIMKNTEGKKLTFEYMKEIQTKMNLQNFITFCQKFQVYKFN